MGVMLGSMTNPARSLAAHRTCETAPKCVSSPITIYERGVNILDHRCEAFALPKWIKTILRTNLYCSSNIEVATCTFSIIRFSVISGSYGRHGEGKIIILPGDFDKYHPAHHDSVELAMIRWLAWDMSFRISHVLLSSGGITIEFGNSNLRVVTISPSSVQINNGLS